MNIMHDRLKFVYDKMVDDYVEMWKLGYMIKIYFDGTFKFVCRDNVVHIDTNGNLLSTNKESFDMDNFLTVLKPFSNAKYCMSHHGWTNSNTVCDKCGSAMLENENKS